MIVGDNAGRRVRMGASSMKNVARCTEAVGTDIGYVAAARTTISFCSGRGKNSRAHRASQEDSGIAHTCTIFFPCIRLTALVHDRRRWSCLQDTLRAERISPQNEQLVLLPSRRVSTQDNPQQQQQQTEQHPKQTGACLLLSPGCNHHVNQKGANRCAVFRSVQLENKAALFKPHEPMRLGGRTSPASFHRGGTETRGSQARPGGGEGSRPHQMCLKIVGSLKHHIPRARGTSTAVWNKSSQTYRITMYS